MAMICVALGIDVGTNPFGTADNDVTEYIRQSQGQPHDVTQAARLMAGDFKVQLRRKEMRDTRMKHHVLRTHAMTMTTFILVLSLYAGSERVAVVYAAIADSRLCGYATISGIAAPEMVSLCRSLLTYNGAKTFLDLWSLLTYSYCPDGCVVPVALLVAVDSR